MPALIDRYGAVMGVASRKLEAINVAMANNDIPQNVNVAIEAMSALNVLDMNGIPPTAGSKTQTPLDATSVADVAKLFTVHVVCR